MKRHEFADPEYPFVTAEVIEATHNLDTNTVLWTVVLKYPRFIHGEVMTHRVFSRNAASSRAIPVKKLRSQVWHDPVMPYHWGKNQSGMQATGQLTGWRLAVAKFLWRSAAKTAVAFSWLLEKLGGHKQWVNRILESWMLMTTVITATEWDNFFELRDHPDAQPEFGRAAATLRKAMAATKPRQVRVSDGPSAWHLPFVLDSEREVYPATTLLKISAARCARVSYLNHDKTAPTLEQDISLYDRLVSSKPEHASPVEHQAFPAGITVFRYNLNGWTNQRYMRDKRIGPFHNDTDTVSQAES